jgi:N-methylhydantoinase A/oxoprolinase/acetone carboxylase beta subunit
VSWRQAPPAKHPIHIVGSGPAAGVIAAYHLAGECGLGDVITLDMGGTTDKASIIESGKQQRAEFEVAGGLKVSAGYKLRVPAIDVVEVGQLAGGRRQVINGSRTPAPSRSEPMPAMRLATMPRSVTASRFWLGSSTRPPRMMRLYVISEVACPLRLWIAHRVSG